MGKLKKLLTQYGDKAVFAAFLIFAFYQIVMNVKDMAIEPDELKRAEETIAREKKSKPLPPELKKSTLNEDYSATNVWGAGNGKSKRNVFFLPIAGDLEEADKKYLELLEKHTHDLYKEQAILIDGENYYHCIFPGCKHKEHADKIVIGIITTIKLHHVTPTKVVLTWDQPDHSMVKLEYCEVQRKLVNKLGNEKWETLRDEKGNVLKFYLGGGELEKNLPGGRPGGGSTRPGKNTPPPGFDEFNDLLNEAGGGLLGNRNPNQNEEREEEPEKPRRASEDEDDEEEPEPPFENLSRIYMLRDKQVDSGKTYEYRIRTHGTSQVAIKLKPGGLGFPGQIPLDDPAPEKKTGKPVVAEWSETFTVKVKGIEKIKFVYYMKGYKKGSPDKIHVIVSDYYNPPWGGPKYKISEKYRNIQVGVKGSNVIGRNYTRYDIRTKDGHKVYIKKSKPEFRYIGDENGSTKEDIKKIASSKLWQQLRVPRDFSTGFLAMKVEEVIDEKKGEKRVFDESKGKFVTEEVVIKHYRYFLHMENEKTKEIKKVELQRTERDLPRQIKRG